MKLVIMTPPYCSRMPATRWPGGGLMFGYRLVGIAGESTAGRTGAECSEISCRVLIAIRPGNVICVGVAGCCVSVTCAKVPCVAQIGVLADNFDNANMSGFTVFVKVHDDVSRPKFTYICDFARGCSGFAEYTFGDHTDPSSASVLQAKG